MTLPLIITLPHCSAELPAESRTALALEPGEVVQSTDLGIMEVFGPLPVLALLPASYSRLAVDLNRAPDDFGSHGVVAAADYAGRPVFRPGQTPDRATKQAAVERWWRPWHQRLAQALARPGVAALIDGHSLDGIGPAGAPDPGRARAEVVLGNRGGADGEALPGQELTCPPELMRRLGAALESRGLSVAYNAPYAGGQVIARHGPKLLAQGQAALQMELNKDLYADPAYSRVDHERAAELSRRLESALASVFPPR
ncbi:MAG: N-formylglutamate amidohydrolase [Desulfarculaceae bacterium]|nr:N-formylglutamate amidohydrolase [Desulfarculaceae bacterium]MCF8072705.1 N-formylglutamate amidohydrolase [Desulfarculaceae bacterium]MCF8102584.1 N-formylglutamate amidohydrolase [Desulfarculaceae bacterium]MCF8116493.1 N-formylglutamate amidohydrolase [Desulfarculaceae bacterium]